MLEAPSSCNLFNIASRLCSITRRFLKYSTHDPLHSFWKDVSSGPQKDLESFGFLSGSRMLCLSRQAKNWSRAAQQRARWDRLGAMGGVLEAGVGVD